TLADKGKFSHEKAAEDLAHLSIAYQIEDLKDCDLIVEAIIENLEIKQKLMQQLEAIVKPEAILASNTSSLSISAIAANCSQPDRVAGYHFFNPVPQIKVVEVIEGFNTRADLVQAFTQLSSIMGTRPAKAKVTP